jgi:hypothetical protein
VFDDFRFWPGVEHVGVFMLIWIPIMVGGSLFFALLLHERIGRFSSAMRLVYFLPGAVTGSAAVVGFLFRSSSSCSRALSSSFWTLPAKNLTTNKGAEAKIVAPDLRLESRLEQVKSFRDIRLMGSDAGHDALLCRISSRCFQ